jgi:hypothetical protein
MEKVTQINTATDIAIKITEGWVETLDTYRRCAEANLKGKELEGYLAAVDDLEMTMQHWVEQQAS